ncbi:hypothetical protein [Rufibacter roseus]|uniref:PH domain-containing protein n=2 Tax=Rufibacter roseus TaxID=1567108 RepID=A0ABW2DGB8_9BACT
MLGMLFKIAAFVVVAHYLVRFLLRIFRRQGKVYYLTPMRQFSLVFWSLISFWLALIMFGMLLRHHTDTNLEQSIAMGLGSILLLFSLPTLLVHLQYWRHERESAMELEKDHRTALLLRPGQQYLLKPGSIQEIVETKSSSSGSFWRHYGYLTIFLRDGRTLTVTSLLIDLETLKALWPHVPYRIKTKWICFL